MKDSTLEIEEDRLRMPRGATTSEAAAIAVAVSTHVADQRKVASEEAKDEQGWDGERFAFAGRLEALGQDSRRVPQNAPTDRWQAAGRADRY